MATENHLNKRKSDDGRTTVHVEPAEKKANIKGDELNIALLIFLYAMQGVALGVSIAVRTLLQNMKISYHDQAKYSMVYWPFSIKLLWAPLIDVVFSQRIGKRKMWLIPVQYLIGINMIFMGSQIKTWLMDKENPEITLMIFMFFCLNTLAATQDIIVDGWALTMLRKENVGYAAMCNATGQSFGIILGYVLFLLLESENFCNKWLRFTVQKGGIVSMGGYFYFWGIAYITATTIIGIFKHEEVDKSKYQVKMYDMYKLVWKILNLETIKQFSIVMLTYEIGYAAVDAVSQSKFLEYGIVKDDIVLVDLSLYPVQMFFTLIMAKYASGSQPMNLFLRIIPYRLLAGILGGVLIFYTPKFVTKDGNASPYYFIIFESYCILRIMLMITMQLSIQSFFSRVSDPSVGGTYMSLLNTLMNTGISISKTIALTAIGYLTIKRCSHDSDNTCNTKNLVKVCQNNFGECVTVLDGYYVEIGLCTIFGVAWYMSLHKLIKNLQSRKLDDWQVSKQVLNENLSMA